MLLLPRITGQALRVASFELMNVPIIQLQPPNLNIMGLGLLLLLLFIDNFH
jgi:hypothetical protein